MIVKINGTPVSEMIKFNEDGFNITFDFHDWFDFISTPINVDFSFSDHNLIKGDVNIFNWAHKAVIKTGDAVSNFFDYVF